jgi:hypothetical protein
MSAARVFRRVRAMHPAELRFRAGCALRIHRDRFRHRFRPPQWDRRALESALSAHTPDVAELRRLLHARQWKDADAVLARHFSTRKSVWPVSARERDAIAASIASRFPDARIAAARMADRIVDGSYDLLGYRGLPYGRLPDWHFDAVHRRRAPRRFWADVPYLDPAAGDHKITWELNRHQHWTSLGRAYALDRNPVYATTFVDQLYGWLRANPPLSGINWASMLELAFRSISWVWALEFFADVDGTAADGRPWRVDLLAALDRQLAHVAQNLSRYFSPNTHLTGEALALYIVSSALPELQQSGARAALGRTVLLEEARRQVLADGGHVERSTHYHRYSTDFYLLASIVARAANDPAASAFMTAARAQATYLRTLADERGGLHTIGDDDGGQLFAMCGTPAADVRTTLAVAAEVLEDSTLAVSPPTEEACWVAGPRTVSTIQPSIARFPPRWPSRLFEASGYFVSRAPGELAIFDAGAHGFLTGGHAHADALAVVTTIDSKPLLIDPGTGTYTMDAALRDRLRSGRMHNTVLVDGLEHTAARGPFHWRRRTDAAFLFTRSTDRADIAQGAHDGYGEVRHVRTLFAAHGTGWLVVDQILGRGPHSADVFWHIDPEWTLDRSGGSILLRHRDGARSSLTASVNTFDIASDGPDARHAPEYGRVESAPVVRTTYEAQAPFTVATFVASSAAAAADIHIEVHACAAPDGWVATAVMVGSPAFEIAALVAAPVGDTRAWPGGRYGISGLQTNGRAALALRRDSTSWHCVAEGTDMLASVLHKEAPATHEMAYAVQDGTA